MLQILHKGLQPGPGQLQVLDGLPAGEVVLQLLPGEPQAHTHEEGRSGGQDDAELDGSAQGGGEENEDAYQDQAQVGLGGVACGAVCGACDGAL